MEPETKSNLIRSFIACFMGYWSCYFFGVQSISNQYVITRIDDNNVYSNNLIIKDIDPKTVHIGDTLRLY